MTRLFLSLVFVLSLLAAPASAQQGRERTPTSRGLTGDTTTLLAARDLVTEMGMDCDVTTAATRGVGDTGDRHYEVACRDAPGYLIVAGTRNTAYNCLLLASQNERFRRDGSATRSAPTCLLRGNRNPRRYLATLAARAGMDCRVDEGRAIGLSPNETPIYEIGCHAAPGAWIELAQSGWVVTDCLEIRSRGNECRFTTEAEELTGVRRWLAGSAAATCTPTLLRSMGRNAGGLSYYEAACADGGPIMVGLEDDRRVARVLPCADAVHIGGGCRTGDRASAR